MKRLLIVLALLVPAVASAQPVDRLSPLAHVSLVTVLPGEPLYTQWGHSAIRVFDPVRRIDVSYNYGTFAFDRYFIPRFVYGELDYRLSSAPYAQAVVYYKSEENRPTIEQELNLTDAQREAVYAYLIENERPENAFYRYDFIFDNCTTRVRDVFEAVLGDTLSYAGWHPPDRTFRQIIGTYLTDQSFLRTGINLLFGTPTDRVPTRREAMFLPDLLMEAAASATVTRDSTTAPFVVRTDTVTWTPGYRRNADTWPWAPILMWLLLAGGLTISLLDWHRGHAPRRRWLDVPLFAFVGVAGLLIVFLWFISLHHVTARNWNLLWLWPTHLAAVVPLLRRRPLSLFWRRYLMSTGVVALVVSAGWSVWPQAMPAAAVPLILLLALRSGWIALRAERGEAHEG